MRDNTIKYKVKVFISSMCEKYKNGEKLNDCSKRYTIVRKGIKTLLEETNLAKVYLFEAAGASSQDVISSYMNTLDDSDLCIFLIDNQDGVSPGIVREQKRARQLGIKSIYLFCDENQKLPTQIQKEIIESKREKFFIIHEFSEFITQGYRSTLQDIINIYRSYCKGSLINKKEDEDDVELKYSIADAYMIKKQLYKGFNLTQNVLLNIVNLQEHDIKETSELDKHCQKLLNVVIGNESVESFNFDLLVEELNNIHEEYLMKFIRLRMKAIKAYFNDNIEECLTFLNFAYNEAISNDSIPNWLSNDVLIDKRNISNLLNETKNKIIFETEAQVSLNENKESVYYPVLDRFDAIANKDILKKCLNSRIETPYTTSFGGVASIFENIASTYVIAVLFGSLMQILTTRNRITDALSHLCLIYNNHSLYIELIKELAICQNDKEIEKISRAYNQTTDILNSNDVDKFISALDSVPISYKKTISKLIIFKNFGYYLSDQNYKTISNEIMDEVTKWINDSNKIFNISRYIFKTFEANTGRLDNNKISNLIISIFKHGFRKWYDDALEVIRFLDISLLKKEVAEELIDEILKIVSQKEIRNNCNSLTKIIIYVRKNSNIKSAEIDECIKTNMEHFFNNDYSLEIFSKKDNLKHINRFVQLINTQNDNQGGKGIYQSCEDNPYQTIRNIIKYYKPELNWDNIELIINAIEGTVFSKKQTISAKIDAIQLLIFLKNNTVYKKDLHKVFDKWMNLETDILCGHEDGFFNKDTIQTLKLNILMLKVCFEEQCTNEMISLTATFMQQNDYEIIKTLECIEVLLNNIDFDLLDKNTLTIFTQYVIGMSSQKETDIRYYSVRILFLLSKSFYRESAMIQISRMMDNDNYKIKACILKSINSLRDENKEIVELIIQKGKVDNNYLVRDLANKIITN